MGLWHYGTMVLRLYGIKEESKMNQRRIEEDSKKNNKLRKVSKVSGATYISDFLLSILIDLATNL